MMKKLLYILICILLAACTDDVYMPSDHAAGHALRFEVTVIDQPETRGHVMDINDNAITKDFKKGDSFGMFIIDGNNQFVSTIDGKNARNIKLTTPDGKAWNLSSNIKEVVHKLGYRYVAYYPYSEAFNDCASTADIQALLTAPATDQSSQAAIDWMYTGPTSPQTNAVTTLEFKHRYAKIDIYHSFTQEHTGSWTSAYKFTRTVDQNNVEHYRYILDAESLQKLSINGTYTIGNYLTGIKEFSYNCNDIAIENGRHAIVYTYGVDERCAVDLGLPSGIKWSPINLGAETGTYMDDAAIASAENKLGRRLAWGELFEKDSYSYDTYINDPYQTGTTLLPSDIAGTVYDPVTQYWGGHWSLPSKDDLNEFIANTEIVNTETVYSTELGKDIKRITFRSKKNGNTITLLTNGYASNTSVVYDQYLYYMSSTRYDYRYFIGLTNNSEMKTYSFNRFSGAHIRPVLKELYIYPYAEKKDIVVANIDALAVDLGITKTVTEPNGEQVTYKLLWSPFNYGAEEQVELRTYNNKPIDENEFLRKCNESQGMRLAWGDLEERARFCTKDYAESAIMGKYNYNNTGTDLDKRDLEEDDDIVYLNWPEGWYIPTAKDLDLLCSNTNVTTKTINGKTWFELTGTNGNSILIPGTVYIDDGDNKVLWGTVAYLQSSTIGTSSSNFTDKCYGTNVSVLKRTIYALNLSGSTKKIVSTAGRPTGLMVRPVKYVRVE